MDQELIKDKIKAHIKIIQKSLEHIEDELESLLLKPQIKDEEVQNLYKKRRQIIIKLKKTESALINYSSKPKTKKRKIEIQLEGIKKKKNHLSIEGIEIGKNQEGNLEVYKRTLSSRVRWYHANVRGGGLVAADLTMDPLLAGAWALIYSKYLTVFNILEGDVSSSEDIYATATKGTFVFIKPKMIHTRVNLVSLYVLLENNKLIISATPSKNTISLKFTPNKGDRFKTLYTRLGVSMNEITNLELLQGIIPYKWDLTPE